jgi:hypothetical protein
MHLAKKTGWVTLLVAASLLTVTLPAAASHNSVGTPHPHVQDPSEFDADSDLLTPDVPHANHPQKGQQVAVGEETSPYHLAFHEDLDDLPPREAPFDQSGDRYTDCTPASDYDSGGDGNVDDPGQYEEALRNGEACYVGYFDQRIEYWLVTTPLVHECPCDLLYSFNPSEDDEYCRGEEDTNDVTGVDQADVILTNLLRTQDENCSGNDHNSFLPGDPLVDVSLLETGLEEAGDNFDNDEGSGPITLPLTGKNYLFLFGQPHPDVSPMEKSNPVLDDGERWAAGSGPFGPNPLELGNPLHDLSNACGDRTEECKLLEPDDILEYDPWKWSDEFENVEEAEQPRVCGFHPQYGYSPIGDGGDIDRDQGVCGNTGIQVDEFIHDVTAGGFGAPGDPPTWVTNLPGWSWGVLHLGEFIDNTDTYTEAYFQDDPDRRAGFINYYAVNPIVPDREDDLRCVTPNILATGDDGVLADSGVDTSEFSDPGIYGQYQADAIDADVYPHAFRSQLETVNDETYDEVRGVVNAANDVLDDASEAGDTVGDTVDELAPEELEELTEPIDEVGDEAGEALDRADTFESSSTPALAQNGTENQRPFTGSIEKGLACNAANELVFRPEEVSLHGGLNFQASVSTSTFHLKDPTVFDEEDLPAPESETDEGYWQTDLYRFGGNAFAFLDLNRNDQFDECPGSNLNPGDDLCPWESLWDAYNDQCTNRDGKPCSEILKSNGYNVDGNNGPADQAGVGLYFVAQLEGPIVVTAETITTDVEQIEDQTEVLGGVGDQVCIVGTSQGFHDYLPNHVDGASSASQLPGALCEDADAATLVTDAFDGQSGVNRGTFSADVEWAKLAPTPDAADNGVEESLCVSGVWSVGPTATGVALDTAPPNNIGLEDGTVHEFSHWQSLETGTDTQPDRASC